MRRMSKQFQEKIHRTKKWSSEEVPTQNELKLIEQIMLMPVRISFQSLKRFFYARILKTKREWKKTLSSSIDFKIV